MQATLQLGRSSATGCSFRSRAAAQPPRGGLTSRSSRQPLQICSKFSNPFEGMFNKGGGGDSDAARRAIERSLGGAGKGKQQPAAPGGKKQQQPAPGAPKGAAGTPKAPGGGLGGLSNLFGGKGEGAAAKAGFGGGFGGLGGQGGGSGGGGGWNWGGAGGEEEGSGAEKPIKQELLELFRGMWVVFWNCALFLAVADILHRSLDWCCQVELLLLVGAPAQAFERVAGKFYDMVEWVESNWFGWKVPGGDDMMPLYKQIALYYPQEHAYTFDSYRYKMSEDEKATLKKFYALRWWERDGGFAGDVTAAEVQAIKDKYNPSAVDLREFKAAKAAGKLPEYWAARADRLKELTGDAQPPVVAA